MNRHRVNQTFQSFRIGNIQTYSFAVAVDKHSVLFVTHAQISSKVKVKSHRSCGESLSSVVKVKRKEKKLNNRNIRQSLSHSHNPMDITKIHKSNQSIKKLIKEVADCSQRSPNGLFDGGWGQIGLLWHHGHVKSRPTLIDTYIILLIFHLESLENILVFTSSTFKRYKLKGKAQSLVG